jgi:outer membrane protein OmpA-like peptidoglycan-associated protein
MKTRTFFTLFLSVLLALPALAQQSGSAAQSQSPSQSSSASPDREPLRPVTSNDFWDGEDPNLGNLLAHPLTTKKYVQKQVAPIRDRINELDDIAATNTRMTRDVEDRTQRGLQLASSKTAEADQHAIDAGTRANGAQQSAQAATTHLTVVEEKVASIGQYKPGSETEIHFASGQTVLSKKAKDALDEMATPLNDQSGYVIEIRGFSAGRGQTAIANSRKMADAVMRYLVVSHNIPVHRIYVLGMGDVPAEAGSRKPTSGGTVEVSLLKNELVSANQH